MSDPVRQEVVIQAHTVVIKVGTNVLADSTGSLDRHRIQLLADQPGRWPLPKVRA
jgi:glutamate 5-kinase